MTRRQALRRLGAGLVALDGISSSSAQTLFTDVAARAGLGAARNVSGAPVAKRTLLEEMGAGVALIDYDRDGWLDIFLVNGATLDRRSPAPTSYLFHNNRDGTFTDVTRRAGLTATGWGQACCVGDFDNDGFDDLFVSYWGGRGNVLYRNNGDGTFTDVSAKAGLAGAPGIWGAGCCFLDYDRDGWLDLFVASYVAYDPARAPQPGSSPICRYNGLAVPCGPQGFAGGTNRLYRNRGDGTFEDVSEKSGIALPRGAVTMSYSASAWRPTGSYGMGAAAADFDNDGWPDIYVACDTAPSLYYRNRRDGTFAEIAVPAGCAFDENGTALGGMGVAVADYDGDGWLDIARTNFSDQITTLYRNNGDGSFHDASIGAGLGVNRKYVGFGAGFGDFDNDTRPDLFIANGHVYAQLAAARLHITYRQRRILYRNLGEGKFADVSAEAGPGVTAEHVGRGCALGDLDNDGVLEIVVNNLDSPPSLLKNRRASSTGNHWLLVKLEGVRSNRSAIGARVTITPAGGRAQTAEVMSGSGYYSSHDPRLHFGLGAAGRVERLEVRWPSGARETLTDLPVDRIIRIREGSGLQP